MAGCGRTREEAREGFLEQMWGLLQEGMGKSAGNWKEVLSLLGSSHAHHSHQVVMGHGCFHAKSKAQSRVPRAVVLSPLSKPLSQKIFTLQCITIAKLHYGVAIYVWGSPPHEELY